MVPGAILSSSPDEVVTPSSPFLPGGFKQYLKLMHRLAAKLQNHLEEVQEPQHSLLDVLQSSGSS